MYRDKLVNQINKHYWIGVITGIGIGFLYFLVPPMIDIVFLSNVNKHKECNTKEKPHILLDCIGKN